MNTPNNRGLTKKIKKREKWDIRSNLSFIKLKNNNNS